MAGSAAAMRTEHVQQAPRGWKVRTIRPGPSSEHEVRIAFPPGGRKKGSGRVVEILHPAGERNPQCEISEKAKKNPGELLIFGNPSFREVLKSGTREVVIWKDAEGTKYHVQPYVNSGETIVKSLGKFAMLETARAKANAWLEGSRNPDLEKQRIARERAEQIRRARLGRGSRFRDVGLGNPKKKNQGRLIDSIRHGDRVTIVNRFGQESTGRAVMRSSTGGWVLNMGGAHGTPGLADDSNVTKVRKSKNPMPADVFAKHQIAIAKATLRMSDEGARIMGGMTKDEARAILQKFGVKHKENPKQFAGWSHFTKAEKNFLRSIHMPAPKNEEEVRAYKDALRKIDEINARARQNPVRMQVSFDPGIKKYLAVIYDPKFGNMYASGFTKKQAAHALHERVREARRKGTWRNTSEFVCRRCGKEFTAAQVEAGDYRKHLAAHRAKRNPSEETKAVQLYKSFHGRDPKEIVDKHVSAAMRLEYAALGDLDYVKVITPIGQEAKFSFDGDGVKLASSPDGKQLYAIGGNQDLRSCLDEESQQKDFIDIGEAQEVQYLARKIHAGFRPVSYFHKFGEAHKDATKPHVMFDKLKKQIFFIGGEYWIDASKGVSPGIEN